MYLDMGDLQNWRQFAGMCNQLIMNAYPEAKPVEGSGGDEGVDAFIGSFDGEIHVYQHKFITGRLTAGHKRQIRESLERARAIHKPRQWTLCVPIEFTPAEIRWFEELQRTFPETNLDWWGAEHLRILLAEYPRVRETFFPREQERMIREIHEVVTEGVGEARFSILELDDVSTAMAKRYSASVLIEGAPSRENIRIVVRDATGHVRRQTHYRNKIREEYWGGSEAHIVWLFLYRSLDDVEPVSWVCRSLWVDPKLDTRARPGATGYDEEVDGILVDWNEQYDALHSFYAERTLDKGAYLSEVDGIFENAVPLVERAVELLRRFEGGDLEEEEFIGEMQLLGEQFRHLYMASGTLGFPPFECRDLDSAFQSLMGHGDNLFLYFSPEGLERWRKGPRTYLANVSVDAAYEELLRFRVLRKRI